jgi:glycogen debranching enzyme
MNRDVTHICILANSLRDFKAEGTLQCYIQSMEELGGLSRMGETSIPEGAPLSPTPDTGEEGTGLLEPEYIVDTRPLCQGMMFVLTDAAHPRLVLKHGGHFLVMDQSATIPGCNTLGYGYYRYDTRHLSQWEMTVDGIPLSLLSSSVNNGYAGSFLYTNPQTDLLPQQTLMVQRDLVLGDALWERIVLQNFHNQPLDCVLKFTYQSDFADMFEVRGLNLPERGQRMMPVTGKNGRSLYLAYRGLDNILVETVVEFFGISPDSIRDGEVTIHVVVQPKQSRELQSCISTRWEGRTTGDFRRLGFVEAKRNADQRYGEWQNQATRIRTEHEVFDLIISRSMRDLYILRQATPRGMSLAAGIPWYCAPFGRDSAIAAWQVMPFLPELAKECITVLSAYQGEKLDQYKAEHPGKIMHELRLGELARIGQIPHTPYYGTADATQLWLFLVAQYIDWSGDLDFAKQLWPRIRSALNFIDSSLDERGYLTYIRESDKGLENQGWKDSGDSVMHADGQLCTPPIALCEVQGYIYIAWLEIARIADLLGYYGLGRKLRIDAAALKSRFEKDFWIESEHFVALALDAEGKPSHVVSSNPGHLLFTGILDDEKANAVADRVMGSELFCGWGIRTLSRSASAYNPMSYHNGSVWPHDNAIIAEGLRKLGRVEEAHQLMLSMLEVAQYEPDFRLPELFCGFERDGSYRPIEYPVSCSPQAWAAGSSLQLLKTCLNLQPDACNGILRVVEPNLPDWLGRVTLRGLRVGSAVLDLGFSKHDGISSCQVLHKSGKIRVTIES